MSCLRGCGLRLGLLAALPLGADCLGPAYRQQLGHSKGARAGPGQAPEGVELAKEPP